MNLHRGWLVAAGSVLLVLLGWASEIEDHRFDPLTTSLVRELNAQMVDRPAPPFALPAPDGRLVSLAEHRGRVVLVNFWASWCEPCRREMPSMIELARRIGDRPFDLVAISHDEDPAAMQAFLDSVGYRPTDFKVVRDPTGAVGRSYGTELLPESYLVDREGRIVARFQSSYEWTADPVVKLIERVSKQAWKLR